MRKTKSKAGNGGFSLQRLAGILRIILEALGQIPPVAVGLFEETIFAFFLHTVIVDTGLSTKDRLIGLLIPTVAILQEESRRDSQTFLLKRYCQLLTRNTTSY